jgi:probable rRNA maturation factor
LKINLSLQQDFQANELPLKRGQIKKQIETALRHVGFDADCEIGIACVDLTESHELNLQYREKDKPTNVLSFPSDLPDEMAQILDSFYSSTISSIFSGK